MLTTEEIQHIKLVFFVGMNEDTSKPIFKRLTYKDVNTEHATLENVYAFSQAMAALSAYSLEEVILSTDTDIIKMGV